MFRQISKSNFKRMSNTAMFYPRKFPAPQPPKKTKVQALREPFCQLWVGPTDNESNPKTRSVQIILVYNVIERMGISLAYIRDGQTWLNVKATYDNKLKMFEICKTWTILLSFISTVMKKSSSGHRIFTSRTLNCQRLACGSRASVWPPTLGLKMWAISLLHHVEILICFPDCLQQQALTKQYVVIADYNKVDETELTIGEGEVVDLQKGW